MSLGEEYIRVQTCLLRVSIHCDDCRKKVENRLKAIDGVYIVKVDRGHGVANVSVTMSPELSPDVLVKKIMSGGKKTFVQLVAPSQLPPAGGGGESDEEPLPPVDVVDPKSRPPSVRPSPARSKPVVMDENDGEEEEEVVEDQEEPEEEQQEEDEEEKVVLSRMNGRGGSRAPSRVASPTVNTSEVISRDKSGRVNENGRMGTANVTNISAAPGTAMGEGDGGHNNNMGQKLGPTQPFYNLPMRPVMGPANYWAGANFNPASSYQLHQLADSPNCQEPHYGLRPNQYASYQYPAPALVRYQKEVIDGFTYQFSDENTGSCTAM